MAEMNKAALETEIRNRYLEDLITFFGDRYDTDALRVSASEIAIPVVDSMGNEKFAVVSVKIPRGTRNGEGGYNEYDGYKAHELYMDEVAARDAKKAASAAKKAAKIAADEKRRAEKAVKKKDV